LFFERKVAGALPSLKIESKFLVKICPELPVPGGGEASEAHKNTERKKCPKQ
jgi:hypothetical protein